MKNLFLIALLLIGINSLSQSATADFGQKQSVKEMLPKFRYYFILLRSENKSLIIVLEQNAAWVDLPDSLFLENGQPRRYKSYSHVFSSLSDAGLDYIESFINPTTNFTFLLWRKRIN
jgi:hypothetical protein